MADDAFRVDTTPDKRFFIDTATRDASVEDCIFDLIDNAVDAGRKASVEKAASQDGGEGTLSGTKIEVIVDASGVSVVDNGAGIEQHELEDGSLRFGRPSDERYSIGLYGIGLNRAIFKLGQKTRLESEADGRRAYVEVDMSEYAKEGTGFDLPGATMDAVGSDGTSIAITQPSDEVAAFLSNSEFVRSLIEETEVRYALFLRQGLEIEINGEPVAPEIVEIRANGPFQPRRKNYMDPTGVSVEIVAGQHSEHRFTIEDDYDKRANDALTGEYGWTVVCNNRVIVHADRESKTGWDGFHPEYYGFAGRISFLASDGRLLPWNTAKSDISLSNAVYQRALVDMRAFAEEWRDFVREVKKIRQSGGTLATPPAKTPKGTPPAKPKKAPKAKPKRSATKVKRVSKEPTYRTVLPADIDQKHCHDKLLKVVAEGMSVDMFDNHYAGLALLRIIFEQAATKFLIRHSKFDQLKTSCIDEIEERRKKNGQKPMTAKECKDYHPNLAALTTWMVRNKSEWDLGLGKLIHPSMDKVVARKNLLNDAIHHPYNQISEQNAISVRDEITPVLRHLIEN